MHYLATNQAENECQARNKVHNYDRKQNELYIKPINGISNLADNENLRLGNTENNKLKLKCRVIVT